MDLRARAFSASPSGPLAKRPAKRLPAKRFQAKRLPAEARPANKHPAKGAASKRPPLKRRPEIRVEAELAAGLFDRYRPVVIGDVVDAVRSAGQRQHGRLSCGIDMERGLAVLLLGPGAWTVEQAVAKHDGLHAGGEDLAFHVGSAAH